MEFVRSYNSIRFGLPTNRGRSAPALVFSRPAQRSLTLRPACSPGRHSDPLHQRLQQFRCLHRCSDCYRVERTSSRAGIPPLWTSTFHGAHEKVTSRDLVALLHGKRSRSGQLRALRCPSTAQIRFGTNPIFESKPQFSNLFQPKWEF